MKPTILTQICRAILATLTIALITTGLVGCAPRAKDTAHHQPIYDTQADGEKLLAEALVVAKRENKHVFAEFGFNSCIWCRRMHELLHSHPEVAPFFAQNYVLVMVDVDEVNGQTHNQVLIDRFGDPTTNGLPGLVLLDADAKVLTVRDTEPFMHDDHYEAARVLDFLKEHAPKRTSGN